MLLLDNNSLDAKLSISILPACPITKVINFFAVRRTGQLFIKKRMARDSLHLARTRNRWRIPVLGIKRATSKNRYR